LCAAESAHRDEAWRYSGLGDADQWARPLRRDYINATVGFTELAEATHIPSKSLMRMLGPAGNPRADNLFEVVSFLQHREGVRFRVQAAPGRAELR
jgi:DNA-binding phage protein